VERTGRAWLSLTPEPEHELPRAIAAMRAGGRPSDAEVAAEADRIERVVLAGGRRRWRRWLRETRRLAERSADAHPAEARLALDVIDNHDALALGLQRRRRGAQTE
jgi:hypothetical protein